MQLSLVSPAATCRCFLKKAITRLRWTGELLGSGGSWNSDTAVDLREQNYGEQHHGDHHDSR